MIEAIIFDMDGVLVDSEPIYAEIEKKQFQRYGISVPEEEHQQYLGTSTESMWKEIAKRYSINEPLESLIAEHQKASFRYFEAMEQIPVMPGLIEILDKLAAKNYSLAVASSSAPEIIELILEKTGLRKYFREVVSAKEAGKSKPEPDIFLLAARKLGAKSSNCLIIEDSAIGIEAAHRARMCVIAYQSPGADPQKQKEADAIINNYAQLEMFIPK